MRHGKCHQLGKLWSRILLRHPNARCSGVWRSICTISNCHNPGSICVLASTVYICAHVCHLPRWPKWLNGRALDCLSEGCSFKPRFGRLLLSPTRLSGSQPRSSFFPSIMISTDQTSQSTLCYSCSQRTHHNLSIAHNRQQAPYIGLHTVPQFLLALSLLHNEQPLSSQPRGRLASTCGPAVATKVRAVVTEHAPKLTGAASYNSSVGFPLKLKKVPCLL